MLCLHCTVSDYQPLQCFTNHESLMLSWKSRLSFCYVDNILPRSVAWSVCRSCRRFWPWSRCPPCWRRQRWRYRLRSGRGKKFFQHCCFRWSTTWTCNQSFDQRFPFVYCLVLPSGRTKRSAINCRLHNNSRSTLAKRN